MFPADFSRDAMEWRKGINSTPFNLEIGCNSDRIDNAKIVTTKQAALIKWKKHSTNGCTYFYSFVVTFIAYSIKIFLIKYIVCYKKKTFIKKGFCRDDLQELSFCCLLSEQGRRRSKSRSKPELVLLTNGKVDKNSQTLWITVLWERVAM